MEGRAWSLWGRHGKGVYPGWVPSLWVKLYLPQKMNLVSLVVGNRVELVKCLCVAQAQSPAWRTQCEHVLMWNWDLGHQDEVIKSRP